MSRTIALKAMLSPSEIVRRMERARKPISKSSYFQSSAFQIRISLCLTGSGFGFCMVFLRGESDLLGAVGGACTCIRAGETRGKLRVQKIDQLLVAQIAAQAAIDFDTRGFKEADETVEARTQVDGLQGF